MATTAATAANAEATLMSESVGAMSPASIGCRSAPALTLRDESGHLPPLALARIRCAQHGVHCTKPAAGRRRGVEAAATSRADQAARSGLGGQRLRNAHRDLPAVRRQARRLRPGRGVADLRGDAGA